MKTSKVLALAVAGLITCVAGVAISEQLTGDPSTVATYVKATAGTEFVAVGTSTQTPLFAACTACKQGHDTQDDGGKRYRTNTVTMVEAETCFWTLQHDATVANDELNDTHSGAGMVGVAGQQFKERPDYDLLLAIQPTYRGICTTEHDDGADKLFSPCVDYSDCNVDGLSGGTCDLTRNGGGKPARIGAFLKCQGDGKVAVQKQVIRR